MNYLQGLWDSLAGLQKPTGYAGLFVLLGEAMGLHCATTDVGDAALLLGGTGTVVPKEDSAALALRLEQLLTLAPEDRASIGQRAKR